MRKIIICGAIFVALVSPSRAADGFSAHREQEIDQSQFGYVDISINPSGKGTVRYKWSNGKRLAGNNFYSIVALVGKDNKPIWSDKQVKGLDGSMGGKARQGEVTAQISIDPAQVLQITNVLFKTGVENCGYEVTGFKCCDNGLEIEGKQKKCEQPNVPKASIRRLIQ
jgi:hypothetical protein